MTYHPHGIFFLIIILLSYLILGLLRFQGLAAFRTIFLHTTRSCVIRSTLSALRPVHAVILSIQLFRGLPLLLLPGIPFLALLSFLGYVYIYIYIYIYIYTVDDQSLNDLTNNRFSTQI